MMNRRDLLKLFGISAIVPAAGLKALEPDEAVEAVEAVESVNAPAHGRSDLKGTIITFTDETGHSMKIHVNEGDITWTQPVEYEYLLDRVVPGDEQPVEVNFDFTYDCISSTDKTWNEHLKGSNTITITITEGNESFKFDNFVYHTLEYDLKTGHLSSSGSLHPGTYTNVSGTYTHV